MKTSLRSLLGLVALVVAVGCSGGATSNEDVNSAATELSKKSAGTPKGEMNVGTFNGGAAGTAAKPGQK